MPIPKKPWLFRDDHEMEHERERMVYLKMRKRGRRRSTRVPTTDANGSTEYLCAITDRETQALGNRGFTFEVRHRAHDGDHAKLGTFTVGRGGVRWLPAGYRDKPFRLKWSQIARLCEDHGYRR